MAPLTHHDILELVPPFARAGRHVDLAASDRAARRIAFRPVEHGAGTTDGAPLRETLVLESFGTGTFELTRTLTAPDGLRATLQAMGPDPGVLLAQVAAVPASRHFSGADQARMDALADWGATQAVRYVNEQPHGGWRYHRYHTTAGVSPSTIASLPTWGAQQDWCMQAVPGSGGTPDRPAAVSGTWFGGVGDERTYAAISPENTAGGSYVSQFWACLMVAIERGIPGSKTAWETVQANVTNLSSWRSGFAGDPRWGTLARNL